MTIRRRLATFVCALAAIGLTTAPAYASTIWITATSITSGNFLGYYGLGDVGGGVGHGAYQLGTCLYDGVSRTNCTVTGTYVQTAASQFTPGATGTFTFIESFLGNGTGSSIPIQVRSNAAGSDITTLHAVPAGSYFALSLSNGFSGTLDFGAPDIPNPQGGQLNWQGFLSNAICSGNPAPLCTVGQVGLVNGANIAGNISPFDMQISFENNPSPVPEPGTWLLLGTGLAALAARRRLRA